MFKDSRLSEHSPLDAQERAAWDALSKLLTRLPAALDHQTLEAAEVSFYDFNILATLVAAPEQTVRVGELAERLGSSMTRMSHTILRLERERLVTRKASPVDRRVTLAVLTDAGRTLHSRIQPVVTALVRELVTHALGHERLEGLISGINIINERIASTASHGSTRRSYRRAGTSR